jgi:thymidine kinase
MVKMSLHIVMGPMFAGKSSEILHITNRYKSLGWEVCLISHSADSRYSEESLLWNHDKQSHPCIRVKELTEILTNNSYNTAKVVIIDEAQFFTDLKKFVEISVEQHGKNVYVVGLDGDANRKPFGDILDCIPLADTVTKLKAFCKPCGDGTEALFTKCEKPSLKLGQVHVGGAEMYQPVCRHHFLIC